ncbi:MAG: HAMP domain-containing protein [Chloroflexota bacterium]|nr:HAMP domain-containing protein [Chloroflexota bacterium]
MRRFAQLSIKSRLILMLLAVSLLSIVVIGYLGWSNGRRALNQAIFNQLTSVRASKAYQIETYFDRIFNHTTSLAEDRMVVEAMKEFGRAYRDVSTWPLVPEWETEVNEYYEEAFLPRLADNVEGTLLFELYRPQSTAATYLQYHYIVANPFPVNEKQRLIASESDTSTYTLIHQRLHPLFRSLVRKFRYEDLFLIDIRTGDIVYSVFKETDFATNLLDGPYRESNFAQLFQIVQDAPEQGVVRIIDFRPYRPSYAAPAAFVASPVYEGAEAIGVLALKLPVDEINNVMTGGLNWQADGLGESGESYLVGSDLLMRSVSRFLLEDWDNYAAMLEEMGIPEEISARIDRFRTSILLQTINTRSVQRALAGEEGTQIIEGYRGTPVLSSYEPLEIPGLEWVILSEMDVDEAFAPVASLQRNILISTVILVLVVTLAAVALSRVFVRPIEKLTEGVQQVGAGDHSIVIDLDTNDEFGDLAHAFNVMVANIREQTELIEEKNAENERLLLTILPAPIAERLKRGERVADRMEQVSVLFIRMLGFAEMANRQGARQSAKALDQLICTLDEAAERFEIERVKTFAETYVAACGLTSPRLDHAKRALDFAVEAVNIIRQFDLEHDEALSMQIGINAGLVLAGVVGGERFVYELWGETVNVANHIHTEAAPNSILVTQEVYDRTRTFYEFERHDPIPYDDDDLIPVWQLTLEVPQPGADRETPSRVVAEPAATTRSS